MYRYILILKDSCGKPLPLWSLPWKKAATKIVQMLNVFFIFLPQFLRPEFEVIDLVEYGRALKILKKELQHIFEQETGIIASQQTKKLNDGTN